eukprot:gene10074-13564_t
MPAAAAFPRQFIATAAGSGPRHVLSNPARSDPTAPHPQETAMYTPPQPFADAAFDVAVMALVIFFVPEPARGVAEMVRVVAPGGTVAAYAWDMEGGGFPLQPILDELRKMGHAPSLPPSADASRLDVLQSLWTGAGLTDVDTRVIDVTRVFADFEDFWSASSSGASVTAALAAMAPDEIAQLKSRVRAGLSADATGRITCSARANAIKGRKPA